MASIVAALASVSISRLQLTWAHVGRGSHLDSLAKLTDPSGNFTAYRTFYGQIDTSCVPYIGELLTSPSSFRLFNSNLP
jgi:son of sevenless